MRLVDFQRLGLARRVHRQFAVAAEPHPAPRGALVGVGQEAGQLVALPRDLLEQPAFVALTLALPGQPIAAAA
jgi:hypothetical protein